MTKATLLVPVLLVSYVFSFSQTKARAGVPAPKSSSAPAPKKTIAEFKRIFLNQPVVINDVPFQEKYCLQWNSAHQDAGGSYAADDGINRNLPIEYRGQTGTVIAVQMAPSYLQRTPVSGSNAFGETISENDVPDPYMEVVVKFSDGAFGFARGFTTTLVPDLMELASKRQTAQGNIESQLPTVIGRYLYAVGFSQLYNPTVTIKELTEIADSAAKMSSAEIPLLTPLTIVKAKYLPETGGVLFKLKLPTGAEAIAYTPSTSLRLEDKKRDFLANIAGSFLSAIPPTLTPREVKAIKEATLFRGMSKDAVDYAIGFKDSENDWGRGGKQRIYFGGKLVVYLDNSGKVEDWQQFH